MLSFLVSVFNSRYHFLSCVRTHISEHDSSHNTWYASKNLIRLHEQRALKDERSGSEHKGSEFVALWCVWVDAVARESEVIVMNCTFSDDEWQTHFWLSSMSRFCTQIRFLFSNFAFYYVWRSEIAFAGFLHLRRSSTFFQIHEHEKLKIVELKFESQKVSADAI